MRKILNLFLITPAYCSSQMQVLIQMPKEVNFVEKLGKEVIESSF